MDKKNLPRSVGLGALALAAVLLSACGQKGPLVLPKSPSQAGKPPAPAASAVPAKD